jgi:hypothetical protein
MFTKKNVRRRGIEEKVRMNECGGERESKVSKKEKKRERKKRYTRR